MHCASLGEFEQGRPIVEAIKKNHPSCSLVLTFFSPSGYEVQKNYELADLVLYLPFDSPRNAARFIELVNPAFAIFIKYEFWYNYLSQLKSRRIPAYLVSGIFRHEQFFFKKGGSFFREMLHCFDHFFVQNAASKQLLNSIGLQNVTISGDTRFDRVVDICSKPMSIEVAKKFADQHMVMVIGSSWSEDMEVLYPLINGALDIKFIIAPHEIEKSEIRKITDGLSCTYQLFSEAGEEGLLDVRVLVIDNIGMLSSLYQYGEMAYIGGAFGEGLHNTLEAATFGMPIVFGRGKDNHKYQEAIDLVKLGGAFEVSTANELQQIISSLLHDSDKLDKVSAISRKYVKNHAGATSIFMKYIDKLLS